MVKQTKKPIKPIKPLSDVIIINKEDKKVTKKTTSKKNVVEVKFKKLVEEAVIPTYAHEGDIGVDITCISVEYDHENDAFIYHTGLACETESNIGCFLMARSSNTKTDAYLPNSIGLVDSYTYRGELLFIFKNRTDTDLCAYIQAALKYDEMPAWKKPFTSIRKLWKDEAEEIRKNPLGFAPYKVGERIGQMMFFEHPTIKTKIVEELSETERGVGGFGSTGK